jgi:LuxR family transcriptional activator of conjugal transfer of Ti plasmids
MTDHLAARMLAFATLAADCCSMTELATAAEAEVALVGMTAIASGMVTGPKSVSGNVFHFNNWPLDWMELYQTRDFLNKDAVPRWAIVSGAPTTWTELMRDLPANDLGHEVFEAAQRHGFLEGMVTPVRTVGGHFGLVSVGGGRDRLLPDERVFLQSVCTAVLHRAEALGAEALGTSNQRGPPSFSRRERECVTLLVQGMTEREIAARLGIKEVTARFYLDNARSKTGARSRTHLAGIAALWFGQKRSPPL